MTEHSHIRRLLPFDGEQLRQHLLRLDEQSRLLRFGSTVSDAFLLNYADNLYRLDALIYGYFVDEMLRAIGELRPYEFTGGTRAEIAFSVEKQWRKKGIGSILMERIVTAARNRGISQLTVFCLPGNDPMRHLANKFGAHMHSGYGELEGNIAAEPATPFSFLSETVREAHGLISAFWDQAGKWTEGTHK